MDSDKIANWLEAIVVELVSKPEKVEITKTSDEMGVLYTLKVDPEDMGKVIGKKGETSNSIRNLLRSVAYNNRVRASLKIHDPREVGK